MTSNIIFSESLEKEIDLRNIQVELDNLTDFMKSYVIEEAELEIDLDQIGRFRNWISSNYQIQLHQYLIF